jgi:hypothetical protein
VKLLAELKRRNVIRMGGLYLVGAWLLIQIAETLLPIFANARTPRATAYTTPSTRRSRSNTGANGCR